MTPERWRQVVGLFNAALEREPARRASFVDEACRGDEELKREVESLLTADSPEGSFLQSPALEVAAQQLARDQDESLNEFADSDDSKSPSFLQQRSKSFFFWLTLATGIVILGCYAFTGVMIYRYGALSKDFGWTTTKKSDGLYVGKVDSPGPAAGILQAGDRLVAINDDPRVNRLGVSYQNYQIAWDDSYKIRVERNTIEQQFELKPRVKRDSSSWSWILSWLIASLPFFVTALLVGILQPKERASQLYCLFSFVVALVWINAAYGPFAGLLPKGSLIIANLMVLVHAFHGPLSYHFFYRFPPGAPRGRFWSWLLYPFYLWAVLNWATVQLNSLTRTGFEPAINFRYQHYGFINALTNTQPLFWITVLVSGCAVLVRNYYRVREADQRRRIKWAVLGIVSTCLFVIFYFVSPFMLSDSALNTPTYNILSLFAITGGMMFMPLAISYAIIKHRVFDINVVIRRSLQYLLARNSLRIVLALPIIGLAVSIFSHPNRTLAEILFRNSIYFYLLLIATIALSSKFRRQLSNWVDRKFFQEAYNQEKILLRVTEDVKSLDSIPEISERVSREVERALHPEHMYLFYRQEEQRHLSLGYSSGGHHRELRIPESFQLLQFMEYQGGAQDFPFPPKTNLPKEEKRWLARLGVNLIVPMSEMDGHLSGLLLLGEKKSEQPYTPNDRKLLETLAEQVAIVYEIVRLKGHVHKEQKIKHEVLERFAEQKINLLKECPTCGACFDASVALCAYDQSELTLSLPVAQNLGGKYRLDRLIGRGGMGVVYEATDTRFERKVAVKILLGNMFGDPVALQRLKKEARAAAALRHPNIITVHDYGEIRAGNAEGAYLVMELAHGSTLRAEMDRLSKIPPLLVAEWFDQIFDGIHAAHESGVIHRDLKPENILVGAQDSGRTVVKILDFGLARFTLSGAEGANSLTAQGMVIGTFGYMSPEQLQPEQLHGEKIDRRSDIFSLGVMVTEALTGQRPFGGKSLMELLRAMDKPYRFPGTTSDAQRLDEVLQKCLAKDRRARFATVGEMQRDLLPAIRSYVAPGTASSLQEAKTIIK